MAKISFADKIKKLFGFHKKIDTEFFEELTDALIEGDIGAKTAFEMIDKLEKLCKEKNIDDRDEILSLLGKELRPFVKSVSLEPVAGKVNVYLVLGVNGVGKTTSVAKMAKYYNDASFANTIMAASDTFRAAAIDQLQIHGERLGIRVVSHQDGADPSAVVFDAAESVASKGGGLVLADTAGRLHNKENLVRELQKIDRVASQKASEGCYKKILVIDCTTGQNALRQAEVFHEAVGVDAVVMTKYDSAAKGGIAISVGKELGLPVAFVCTGEGYKDIQIFNPDKYINEFLGLE
ncbi:MAG: signal recognition particle-docking protein FtsY [Treponema sp.]|nr:signal recognition particle-docking protein FtsY [Treponema sp.]